MAGAAANRPYRERFGDRLSEAQIRAGERVEWFEGALARRVDSALPEWAERETYLIKCRTTVGSSYLERFATAIPDFHWRVWSNASIIMAGLGVLTITLLLLAGFVYSGYESILHLLSMDLQQPTVQPTIPEFNPHMFLLGMFVTAISFVIAVIIFIVAWWLVLIPLLPGLTLHELGHYVSMIKTGVGVKSYGLLLLGPLPMGAFVEMERTDVFQDISLQDKLAVISTGVFHSTWLGVLLIFAAKLSSSTLLTLALGSLGAIEIANSLLNCIPAWKTDGRYFIHSILFEWWGFHRSLSEADFSGV